MNPQHIISLQAENVKRISAVEITTAGAGTVVLSGKNTSGKSSVLDAIEMAFAGKRTMPPRPIRDGSEAATIIIKTEDLIVTREITPDGSVLKVGSADGAVFPSPQTMMDKLISLVGFDPLSFARMDAKTQAKELLRVCPVELDLEANAAKARGTYDARTEANREVARIKALLASVPAPAADVPTTEVSVTALADEHQRIRMLAEAESKKDDAAQEAERVANVWLEELANANAYVDTKERELEAAKAEVERVKSKHDAATTEYEQANKIRQDKRDYSTDIAAARNNMANAEQTNRTIRAAAQYRQTQQQYNKAAALAKQYDDKLTQLTDERSQALAEAKFPVAGLSIAPDGTMNLNGKPLCQASTAEQIILGVKLSVAANRGLRVAFIRDGSLLDKQSMAELETAAKEHNLQIWIERVEDSSPMAIQIVDGTNLTAAQIEARASTKPQAAPRTPGGADLLSDVETASEPPATPAATKGKRKSAPGVGLRA